MTTVLQTTFSIFFFQVKLVFLSKFHLSLFLSINLSINLFGTKPLSQPKMAHFTDAYMRHATSMSGTELHVLKKYSRYGTQGL